MDPDDGKQLLNPASLTVTEAARLLTRAAGQPVTMEMLQAVLADGAPAKADGCVLSLYGANFRGVD